ncbi:hypothetical protein KR038_001828 [Drosophila bunnanda]|nr:hypothetical protein KR038_001828 [Drosophila bunnanda]
MAPFNKCTYCQVRTRKVIRDRVTRKNIYVCPTCFKKKKHLEKDNKIQPEEDIALENVDEKNSQKDVPEPPLEDQPNDEIVFENVAEKPPEEKEKLNEALEKGEENKPPENVQEKSLPNDMAEEMPSTSTATNANSPPKVTPPLMEIVFINNRKYIAVSSTADA